MADLKRRRLLTMAVGGAAACALPQLAAARDYPDRPVRFIVPVSPGGGTDIIARVMADYLAHATKVAWVVENQAGAGGQIACQSTARAAPDGYSLMLGYVSTHGTVPAFRRVPYDPIRDFTHIAMIGGAPNVLVTNKSGPATFEQFLEDVKSKPGKESYASAGVGTITHLIFEELKLLTHTKIMHVPYRGIAPGLNDLVAGRIQYAMPGLAGALPYVQSGRLTALAVSGAERAPLLPEVRTFKEIGLPIESVQWIGIMGPARIPAGIVHALWLAVDQVLKQLEVRQRLASEGIQVMPMSQKSFSDYVSADFSHWQQIVKDRGLREA